MLVVVGRVVRAHGVRGEVSVDVRTDDPASRFATGAVLLPDRGARGPLEVAAVRPHQGRLLVSFTGVADRTAAEGLRGVRLRVELPDDAGGDDPDEFYDAQLEGLRAESPDGEEIGTVTSVLHGRAQELLVVRRPDGAEALVPFVAAIVPTVDLAGGRLVVDAPAGLL